MKKYNKYNAYKVVTDDGKFDSKREYEYWLKLKELEQEGKIEHLQRQVKYVLIPKTDKYREVSYVADFVYVESGIEHIIDVKGMVLPEFRIKQKIFYFTFGKEIEIVK